MEKISGFGGFFFRSKDPKALAQWYETHFGINSMASGELWRQKEGPTVFAPFAEDTDYFGRREQGFMLNFRVDNLDAMLAQLRQGGVKVDEKILEEQPGRFARAYDPDGNPIELWEPSEDCR